MSTTYHKVQHNSYICCVAGKSAGHIIPGLTYIHNNFSDYKLLLLTTNTSLDYRIVAEFKNTINHTINYGINQHKALNLDDFPGKKIFKYPLFILKFLYAFSISFITLYKTKPKKIVSMGGYISLPVCWAGWVLRIPIELFELNAIPGRAAYALAPWCTSIKSCFKETQEYFPAYKVTFEPYPVRFKAIQSDVNKKNIRELKQELYNNYNLDKDKLTLFIMGGSQGSEFINTLICALLDKLKDDSNIIHQVGAGRADFYKNIYNKHAIKSYVFEYAHDLEKYYRIADKIIARSGAGTLFELAYLKKKSVIIPLPHAANNHQVKNARAIKLMYPDLFSILDQKELETNPSRLLNYI